MPRSALEKARDAPGSAKARLLEAAEQVFAARGFEGASTRDIAARAAVNISSLHYHWESKETLYAAVFRDVYDRLDDLLEHALAPLLAEHRPRAEVIDAILRELVGFFARHPSVPRLLMRRLIDDEPDLGIEREVLTPAWNGFAEWLDRHGHRPPDTEARLFVVTVHTAALVYQLDSRALQTFLGGSVRRPPLADAVRRHLVTLVQRLLPA